METKLTGPTGHNPPAFPPHGAAFDYVGVETGMSLRDWMAGQALIGILGGNAFNRADRRHDAMARQAYTFADAMLCVRTEHEPTAQRPDTEMMLKDALDAVELAFHTFEKYARMHKEKGTPEGDEKAEANRVLAALMGSVLAKAGAA